MIKIVSKRSKQENILKKYPNAIIADVTSQAKDGLVKLSPFYPHGGIPVPFSDGMTATCVEAVWQGLSKSKTIVLLDYNTCCDVDDLSKPLSHAFLVKAYAEGLYPYDDICIESKNERNNNTPIQLNLFN